MEHTIRLFEKSNNSKGDLFGRLMSDLFIALGYEQAHLNIHKSGRELDLVCMHRLESRRAIAECKATNDKIGGSDINKFAGALEIERDEHNSVTGYFISLSGFTETAIEQEKLRRNKIILLTGGQIIDELIKGRIIIDTSRAMELAGRVCTINNDVVLNPNIELIAHERGWIWLIYYTNGKEVKSFVLIHADGTPLARSLSEEIIAADKFCNGNLYTLNCLNPTSINSDVPVAQIDLALAAYNRYLAEECGYIQLDGLPADSDVGSRRLKLETLYVPLHLDLLKEEKVYQQTGHVLNKYRRLALLAPPGGGKSTLIKRLAVAYADPNRRTNVSDGLPAQNWFPLFFRCRDLRGLARASFAELLEAISLREPVRQYSNFFLISINRALVEGRVLLLVDGLDEISDAGDRAAFVCTMRTALLAYPNTSIIVTSREAGFRHVAAHLASVCTSASISSLQSSDIKRLSVAWHVEVVGDTKKVRSDAELLANTISINDRILRLAVNPLLLTTLLLVKRWVGSLPTRRAILYGKAVEVLLMTWNTEGHEPIPEDEALPQLCYLASTMMISNVERISRPRLAAILQEARNALPAELGYVKGTVEEFIHRVEDRSSLLMMTGHDVEDGRLVEFFEFRHLTFQEFLTARAMVEGWHPNRRDSDSLVDVLSAYINAEKWREVIPLAASLGGKETGDLIKLLTEKISGIPQEEIWRVREQTSFITLGHCLADEAAARPDIIRLAMRSMISVGIIEHASFMPMLVRGRYAQQIRAEAEEMFLSDESLEHSVVQSLKQITWGQLDQEYTVDFNKAVNLALEMVNSEDVITRCKGALVFIHVFGYNDMKSPKNLSSIAQKAADSLLDLLLKDNIREKYVAAWGLYEIGLSSTWSIPTEPDVIGEMFRVWQTSLFKWNKRGMPATIISQDLMPREKGHGRTINIHDLEALFKIYGSMKDVNEQCAALVIAYYTHYLGDEEIVEKARSLILNLKSNHEKNIIGQLLAYFGDNEYLLGLPKEKRISQKKYK